MRAGLPCLYSHLWHSCWRRSRCTSALLPCPCCSASSLVADLHHCAHGRGHARHRQDFWWQVFAQARNQPSLVHHRVSLCRFSSALHPAPFTGSSSSAVLASTATYLMPCVISPTRALRRRLYHRECTRLERRRRRLSTSLLRLSHPSLASAPHCTAIWPALCFGTAISGDLTRVSVDVRES